MLLLLQIANGTNIPVPSGVLVFTADIDTNFVYGIVLNNNKKTIHHQRPQCAIWHTMFNPGRETC